MSETPGTFDTTTTYLGFTLPHPIVPSAGPFTGEIDHLHRLVDAGAPMVVLPSLFEEQVEHEAMAIHRGLDTSAGISPEAPEGYFPEMDGYNTGPEGYLELLGRAKEELDIPVVASLNGDSPGGWTLYARILEDRGADALELNIYHIASDGDISGSAVESSYVHLVESVRKAVDIPLAVKIGPYFSSLGSFSHRLTQAGADALVLFNRFYQPDIDLETLHLKRDLELSRSSDSLLVLRWIGMLSGRVDCQLAATTGIHTAEDAVKMILVGADVTMMTSALLLNGHDHLATVRQGLETWFIEHEYDSVGQARGSASHANIADPSAFERANYMKTLIAFSSRWREGPEGNV